jgi:hypothetical protein
MRLVRSTPPMEVDAKRVSCRGWWGRDMESVTFVVESCGLARTAGGVAAPVFRIAG